MTLIQVPAPARHSTMATKTAVSVAFMVQAVGSIVDNSKPAPQI